MTAPWDRRSTGEHRRVRDLALSRWLPAATSMSAYWSQRAESLGVDPRSLTSRSDLERFAPVLENDVRTAGGPGAPALLMRPTNEQVKAHASGSVLVSMADALRRDGGDGERRTVLAEYKPLHVHRGGVADDLAVAYSRSDLDRLHRCGARAAQVLGLDDADYLVSAVPAGPTLDWWGVYHLAMGASILALHPRGAGNTLERVLDSFSLLPVTVVAVAVDEAVDLAALLVDHGVDAPRVHTVLTVGAPPDAGTRHAIREAWRTAGAVEDGLVVRALWAPSEGRAPYAEPRAEPTGLVTYPDLEVLEVLDPITAEPAAGGGDLTLTTLGWHGTALLRYQTGAYVEGITEDRCPASGITAPRIVGEVVPQAWQPPITGVDDGAGHLDFRGAGVVLGTTPGVDVWRVELRGPTATIPHDHARVEIAGSVTDAVLPDLRAGFEERAGVPIGDLEVVPDPTLVEAAIGEAGSPFLDAR